MEKFNRTLQLKAMMLPRGKQEREEGVIEEIEVEEEVQDSLDNQGKTGKTDKNVNPENPESQESPESPNKVKKALNKPLTIKPRETAEEEEEVNTEKVNNDDTLIIVLLTMSNFQVKNYILSEWKGVLITKNINPR